MIKILLQLGEHAITPDGSINANWVLVGITFVAFFLFWRMLNKIEKGMEKVIASVATHDTEIQLLKKTDVQHEKDIEYLKDKV